jgi:hypothetical protein
VGEAEDPLVVEEIGHRSVGAEEAGRLGDGVAENRFDVVAGTRPGSPLGGAEGEGRGP